MFERLAGYVIVAVLWGFLAATQAAEFLEDIEGEEMTIYEDPDSLGYWGTTEKTPDTFPKEWTLVDH